MEKIKIKQVKIEPVNVELDEPFTIAIGTKYSIEIARFSFFGEACILSNQ
jgi:hypothetical protein